MQKNNQNPSSALIQLALDFVPLLLFFISFKVYPTSGFFANKEPIIFASMILGIATFGSLIVSKLCGIKINKLNFYSSVIVVLFASLTIVFNNPNFIKIKITIINSSCAIFIYIFCLVKKKSFVKTIFDGKVEMTDQLWLKIDKRLFFMFVFMAIINEFCWRNFSTQVWVDYKVFVAMPLMMLFFALQIPYFKKHAKLYF